jgi:myo-inositol-1(or 4)-monophosphatase
MGILRDVMQNTSGLRRPGSAALDLAWTAAGRYDGFFETGLKPWDIAAGTLIITEAGGMVSDFTGGEGFMKTCHVCAGNPDIHPQLLKIIEPHLTPKLKGK